MWLEEAIAAAGLARPRRCKDGYLVCCPAHDDHEPSLRIWVDENDEIAFHCHAGCDWSAVRDKLRELGLRIAQPDEEAADASPEAVYDYRDEAGRLLYQVVRYRQKRFRQRRPDGSGGWAWGLEGARRVPFRLPELMAAVAADQAIHITEGEKDALAVVAAGGAATCNSGGAGQWRPEFAEFLQGATVIVVADKDEPGRRHARSVADSLDGVAAQVNIVEAASGKDAADHLAAGRGLSELVPIVPEQNEPGNENSLRAAFMTGPELARSESEAVSWLLPDYLAAGATTQLTGQPKAGKTTWALCLAAAVADGATFLGRQTTRSPVVYLTEQTKSTFKVSARGTGVLDSPDVHVLLRSSAWSHPWHAVIAEACAHCAEIGARLLVVDTLGRWASLEGDAENDAGAALTVMQPLEEAAAAGLSVLVLRHERKNPGSDIIDAGRGSSAYAGAFDQLLSLKRTGGAGHANRRRLCAEGRFEETPRDLVIDFDGGRYLVRGTATDVERSQVRALVLDMLPESKDEALTFAQILAACGEGASKSTLERVLGHADGTPCGLLGQGRVLREKHAGSASSRAFGYWQERSS